MENHLCPNCSPELCEFCSDRAMARISFASQAGEILVACVCIYHEMDRFSKLVDGEIVDRYHILSKECL